MNKQKISTALWGLLLIILGVGALAYNFGALDDYKLISAYIVAALLAAMGAIFLLAIAFQRENWFYVIPGFSLLSLGGMVYLTTLENVRPEWLGALFLGGIALGFLLIFLRNRQERWWALLQAETIFIIALVGLGLGIPPEAARLVGSILFGGFALSFFFVWLFSGHRGRFVWALILAGVLAVFAAVIFASGQNQLLLMLWPVLLLLLGVFLIARALSSGKEKQKPAVDVQEARPALEVEQEDEAAPAQIQLPDTMQAPPPAESEPAVDIDGPQELEVIEPEVEDEV